MNRIPFGVSQFDSLIGGGSPPGSVVLLAGDAGAGAREFAYTSATINALGHADTDQFDLHYGEVDSRASLPEEIHYVSFTASAPEIHAEITHAIDEELVSPASELMEFEDLSTEYFQLSPIPHDWYVEKRRTITDLGQSHSRRDILEALGEYLTDHASGNLVVIDSLTDLIPLPDKQADWHEISMLLKGMKKASQSWGGLILVLVDQESITNTQMGELMGATDGTISFEWERGGNERARTMFVREFRGVLSRIEDENIIRFEIEIQGDGLDISNVRKIR
ncbi:RecA-superfamily ATPase, KaiC/GvpD/RAD55 family [Haladaptatus litoreus]|uniref:RecA-superfamily ATPase, KaiC/GvpD/RAD55 family n=1 Tax=Haladaptatus litoreus TaxID=553468 RepID=A0A1N6ZJW0_9EURY|nr:HTR-like protein [Haladaptatus litoreus]SIR27190.1 RecA-superfamily ATPase, KaiC/GvpD/RAD55 family [Haladaptatus litoreus]